MNKKFLGKALLYLAIIITFGLIIFYAINGAYMTGTPILGAVAGVSIIAGFILGREPKATYEDDDEDEDF